MKYFKNNRKLVFPFLLVTVILVAATRDAEVGSTTIVQAGVSPVSNNSAPIAEEKAAAFYKNFRNEKWYIYTLSGNNEAANVTDKVDNQTATQPVILSEKNIAALPNVAVKQVAFSYSKTDHPPYYSAGCAKVDDLEICSNYRIGEFIERSPHLQKAKLNRDQETTVYVTFKVEKSGKIGNQMTVINEGMTCINCAEIATQIIADMNTWVPAMKDGAAVASNVTLPIQFNYFDKF